MGSNSDSRAIPRHEHKSRQISPSASPRTGKRPRMSLCLPLPPSQSSSLSPAAAQNLPVRITAASKTSCINIDPEGDVILAVPHSIKGSAGSAEQAIARFRVNSHILGIASPVFRAIISKLSSFKETTSLADSASNSEPTEIQLRDNPLPLAMILRAIHLQSDWVPDSLTTEQLYQVAIICDKYDMRQSLELWLRKWIPQRESEASTYPHKWLFISIAFARKQILSNVSRELILSYAPAQGHVGSAVFDQHVPPIYVEGIRKRRETVIKSIVAHLDNLLLEYLARSTSTQLANGQLKCQLTSHQTELCDTFMLGHLIREFNRIGAYPVSPSFKESSVNDIRALLHSVTFPQEIILQKPIDCCKKPWLRPSAMWNGPSEASAIKCENCYKSPPEPPNHANCSPARRLVSGVDNIIAKVPGLEYREDAGKSPVKELHPPAAGTDLWNGILTNAQRERRGSS